MEPDPGIDLTPERIETDAKLRREREQADEQLAQRASAVEKHADEVVELARERADHLLATEREQADSTRLETAGVQTLPRSQAIARASEDNAVTEERAGADDELESERIEERRAIKRLLRLERADTDERLLAERMHSDRAVASRDDFLSMVSHDVRGVLAGMSTSGELLLLTPQDTVEGKRIHVEGERILRLTWRMNRLVGDLLDMVSIESGKLHVAMLPGDTELLLDETMESFHPSAAARGITLTREVTKPNADSSFDHDRILQVLTNLVGNALKFTRAGGTIALRLAPCEEGIQFTVRDNGCGIAAEAIGGIFERFSQGERTDRSGLGLGLYIAHSIVAAHGGRIWVESKLGEGSAFHFTLPVAPPA